MCSIDRQTHDNDLGEDPVVEATQIVQGNLLLTTSVVSLTGR